MLFRSTAVQADSGPPLADTRSIAANRIGFTRPAALLCVIWLLFAMLECLVALGASSVSLHDHTFNWAERLSLLAFDLAALTLFVPILAIPFLPGILIHRTGIARHRWARILGLSTGIGMMWFLLLLLGASWGGFCTAGSFLDRAAIRFWTPQPIQIFHYVHPLVLYGTPLVALALAVALVLMLGRWFQTGSAGARRFSIRLFAYCFAAVLAVMYIGYPTQPRARVLVNDPLIGVPYTIGEWYSRSLRTTAGAYIHGLLDIRRQLFQKTDIPVAGSKIAVSYPPIVSMDQYMASADQSKIKRMNVVVVMCESLRADVLHDYGAKRNIMPHMERVVAQSQVFTDAYTTASHTNYAEMTPFSSQYPLRSDETYLYPDHIPFPRVMIYDILKSLHYRTAIFASANLDWGRMVNYLDTGNIDRLMHAANWGGPTYVNPTDTKFAAWVAKSKHAGSIEDRYTVDEAIKWVDQQPDVPFFIYFNFQSTHFPYRIPADAKRKFSDGNVDFVWNFPREQLDAVRNLYDDSAYHLDQQLGRFLDHLHRSGLWDNTIIIFSGDHGEAFLEHNFTAHAGPLYNEVMKIPLVMRIPGMAPRRWDRLADHIDVAPTLLHALGLPPHPAFQGIDLFGPPSTAPRTVYMVAQSPLAHQYALVRGRYKLLYDQMDHKRILYDLSADPGEKIDIADRHPDIVRELSERLDTWRAVQVGYYGNALQQKISYAPIVSDQ